MNEFFRSELGRFRNIALVACLGHLLVLGYIGHISDLAQANLMTYRLIGIAYAAMGALLGLYQMGSYRRPGAWVALLHRPMPRWQIAAGLLLAGGLVLAIAVAIPVLATLGWQASFTARIVDWRHAWLPVSAWLVAACGYLVGAYGMLASRRVGASAAVLLLLLLTARAVGVGAIAVQALLLVALASMVAVAFRPNRTDGPRGLWPTVVMALPLQMAVYLAAWTALTLLVQLDWLARSSADGGGAIPGGAAQAQRAKPRDLLSLGLQASTLPQARAWNAQLNDDDVQLLGAIYQDNPIRGSLGNIVPGQWADTHTDTHWTFSHDRMRMVGRGLSDDRTPRGVLGVGRAQAAFPTVAVPRDPPQGIDSKYTIFLAGRTVYRHVADENAAEPWLLLPAGETIQGEPTVVGKHILLQGNKALYVFDLAGALRQTAWPVSPEVRVTVPGSAADLARVESATVDDGLLLSFTFTGGGLFDALARHQDVLLVDGRGGVTTVSHRILAYDLAGWYRHAGWWLSPAMDALDGGAKHLFQPTPALGMAEVLPADTLAVALAISLCLLAGAAAAWRVRRVDLAFRGQVAWVTACVLVGLPALASLWLLYPRGERVAARLPLRAAVA